MPLVVGFLYKLVMAEAASGIHNRIWFDMESRLQSKTAHHDIFRLAKFYQVNTAVCQAGLKEHPSIVGLKPV
jgi:hypothetical protein